MMTTTYTTDIGSLYNALDVQTLRDNAGKTALSSGISLMQKKRYKEATAAFRQAATMSPTNTDAYNFMAQAYMQQGDTKNAIEAYKLSLKIFASGQSSGQSTATEAKTRITLANIYIQEKRPADAESELRKAMQKNPTDEVAPYTLGQVLLQQEKVGEAEILFRRAVKLAPKDGNAYYGLGTALNKAGKTEEAITVLQKALTLKKGFDAAMLELGSVYFKAGDEDKAQEQVTALKELKTDKGTAFAFDLAEQIRQPKMTGINTSKSTFQSSRTANYGPVQLLSIDPLEPQLAQPDGAKEFSMTFSFDSKMDVKSVMDVNNWRITKANNPLKGGFYDNSLRRSTDTAVPFMPSSVSYDPTTREATIKFTLRQNATVDATIDPSKIIFTFNGKDATGKKLHEKANEYNGYVGKAF